MDWTWTSRCLLILGVGALAIFQILIVASSDIREDDKIFCSSLIKLDEPTKRSRVLPRFMNCPQVDRGSCSVIYKVKEGVTQNLYKVCAESEHFLFGCERTIFGHIFKSTILISSYEKNVKIDCDTSKSFTVCTGPNENLFVTYTARNACPFFFDEAQIIGRIKILQQPVSHNLVNLVSSRSCYMDEFHRHTLKSNGTVVSNFKPGLNLCDAQFSVPFSATLFCMKFTVFDTQRGGASVMIDFGNEKKMFSARYPPGYEEICLNVREVGQININIIQGVNYKLKKQGHTFVFDYFYKYDHVRKDNDSDDGNDALYSLFAVPGVIVLIFISYYCCKKPKENGDTERPQSQLGGAEARYNVGNDQSNSNSDDREVVTLSTERGVDRERSTEDIAITEIQPSTLSEEPLPSVLNFDEPPSYESLFPEPKNDSS